MKNDPLYKIYKQSFDSEKDVTKLEYPIEISFNNERTEYFIDCPELGLRVWGNTFEEAYQKYTNERIAWLKKEKELNHEIPMPSNSEFYSGKFRLRIPKSLHEKLSGQAKEKGMSLNQYCIELLSKDIAC